MRPNAWLGIVVCWVLALVVYGKGAGDEEDEDCIGNNSTLCNDDGGGDMGEVGVILGVTVAIVCCCVIVGILLLLASKFGSSDSSERIAPPPQYGIPLDYGKDGAAYADDGAHYYDGYPADPYAQQPGAAYGYPGGY
eukprot:NODE_1280_length_923_cov_116.927136_g1234_i0.p1 GENE.NODE_1280_length_923_cov_116.927136_g1234_i0~~NODE_1280_length_923_cov_116.927136_g1234_i0.p1  ORF type:complete len:137 (+),score=25.36 NODE_1280_length_923_cov_116.927136_g1234_i0:58-468(+)